MKTTNLLGARTLRLFAGPLRNRTTLLLLPLCAGLFGLNGVAYAGHWDIIPYASSGFYSGSTSTGYGVFVAKPQGGPILNGSDIGSGTARFKCVWNSLNPMTRQSDGSKPPATVTLRISSSSSAWASITNPNGVAAGTFALSADDGQGGTKTNSDGGDFLSPDKHTLEHTKRQSSESLVQIDTSGSSEVAITLSPSASAKITAGNSYYCQALAQASAYLDTRGVKITRPGAVGEKSYSDSKGQWVTEGDSIYGYVIDLTPVAATEFPNEQTFQAQLIEGANHWSVKNSDYNVTYSWSPASTGDEPPDTITSHKQMMPKGNLTLRDTGWGDTPTGTAQKFINYTITDLGDGATASAKYILNLHDPYEISKATPYKTYTPGTKNFSPRIYTSVEPTYADPSKNEDWNITWKESIALNFTSSLGAEVKAGDFIKFGAGVDFKASASLEATNPGSGSTTINRGFKAYPYFQYSIRTEHFLVDKWNKAGKDGATGTLAYDYLDSVTPRWSNPIPIDGSEPA